MKILIRATNWIGDAIMSLPAIRAIRGRYPAAEVTVLAKPWVAALYEGESAVDHVIEFDARPGARDLLAKLRLARQLRELKFDMGVLFPNSFESAAILKLAGIRHILGYARDGRGFLLNQAIPVPLEGEIPRHERFYYLELLRRAGMIDSLPEVPEIRFEKTEERKLKGEEMIRLLKLKHPVIGVSPGAAYGSAKRWLPERFGQAAARLKAQTGGSVMVFGSAAEREMCGEVAKLCDGINYGGGTTLAGFLELTSVCSVFLTNDSGAMHIATASGVPTVTIFGPTDETTTGPLGPLSKIVREPVECAPCLKRECPIDHRCMTRVDVDRVVHIAETLLADRPVHMPQ